ncbi:hypothetical protein TREES_T100017624 [Tupaia chinensis]|uniref:Uncharacterized protein n=1 Tax=Tupaia chinensis TaxID=246437 RepID=L9L3Z6_TUPCH|nr:hypothetical protein TREES_T100017624 [Tupaia chinensis]
MPRRSLQPRGACLPAAFLVVVCGARLCAKSPQLLVKLEDSGIFSLILLTMDALDAPESEQARGMPTKPDALLALPSADRLPPPASSAVPAAPRKPQWGRGCCFQPSSSKGSLAPRPHSPHLGPRVVAAIQVQVTGD